MRMKFRCFSTILLVCLAVPAIHAAPRLVHIRLSARGDRDSVVLRWAPVNAAGWRIAGRIGYFVERIAADANGNAMPGTYQRRTKEPVWPWYDVDCRFNINSSTNYAAIAAHQLYPDDLDLYPEDTVPIGRVPRSGDTMVDRFSAAVFCADNEGVAAMALGWRYYEKSVEPGARYIYRVFVAGNDPTVTFDTAYALVDIVRHSIDPAPPVLTAEGRDQVITLRWRNSIDSPFGTFFVSRSQDNGATYNLISMGGIPGIIPESAKVVRNIEYVDSPVANYRTYKYRVVGVKSFAEISEAANCAGTGRDLTPPHVPLSVTAKAFGPRRVLIGWHIDTTDRDLDGYFIERSMTPFGGIRLTATLLDNYKREYLDTVALEGEAYYCVGAIDTAGNIIRSAVVKYLDPDAPESMPMNPYFPKPKHSLAAAFDSLNQRVTLTWKPPASTEKKFYEIYRRLIGGPPVPYRTVEARSGTFDDLYLIGPGHYEYELRALPEDKNIDVTDVFVQG